VASAQGKAASAYWIIGILIVTAFVVGVGLWLMVGRSTRTLQSLAADISGGANQVASAASQLASSSQSLAQAASEQAATLEETAASSQHLAGQTRSNLEHTQGASESVAVADKQIAGANRTLELMVGSMQEITASSSKISRIIKVIDEIAFQTNILALNAAVEAARAGDAGMGFAVVADEVRNLAQRCAQAAKDTAQLIEESIEKSNGGQAKLGEVVQAIRGITDSSTTIRGLVEKVNDSSRDQSRSIEQISTSVTQMQRVTQSTAASAEESAAASEQMNSQAETMKEAVARLHELVGGTESDRRGRGPRAPRATASSAVSRSFDRPLSSKPSAQSAATADPFPMDQDFREF
jgi:methyl-accepting chemotaxis protein/methyl-accepting chemotaxis protein-1 (serine sensor receptor)